MHKINFNKSFTLVCLLLGFQLLVCPQISGQQVRQNSTVDANDPAQGDSFRDPFDAAKRRNLVPNTAQESNQDFKNFLAQLIEFKVLALVENESRQRLAFIKLPSEEIISVSENDRITLQDPDKGIKLVDVVGITPVHMVVNIDSQEIIIR